MTAEAMAKMCLRKKMYSYNGAYRCAGKVRRERGVQLRVYGCPVCQTYHLTKEDKR